MKIEFENTDCNICNSNHFNNELIIKDNDLKIAFNIVKCNKCGLVYLNPRPNAASIGYFYNDEYSPFTGYSNSIIDKIRKIRTKRAVNNFSDFIGNSGRILEIGCGNGEVLSLLKKNMHYDLYGIEQSEIAVKRIKENLHIDVHCGTLENADFESNYFDAIILNHVIEHLFDPMKTIKEISRILKADGKLIFSTPNIESIEYKIFGKYWYGLAIPIHLFFFSEDSLQKLLHLHSFVINKIKADKNPNTIYQSILNIAASKGYDNLMKYFKIPILILSAVFNNIVPIFGYKSRFIYYCKKNKI